jgi:serine/threonine-protein kinase RsbW
LVQVSFQLSLPRDEASVSLTRRLIAQALEIVGVEADTVSDVEIALSEACANVLRHAKSGDEYEVRAGFNEERAFLEIIDHGDGFDPGARAPEGVRVPDESESGRGVMLMRALMDKVRFESRSGDGNTVILEKRLVWRPDSPVEQLLNPTAASETS